MVKVFCHIQNKAGYDSFVEFFKTDCISTNTCKNSQIFLEKYYNINIHKFHTNIPEIFQIKSTIILNSLHNIHTIISYTYFAR